MFDSGNRLRSAPRSIKSMRATRSGSISIRYRASLTRQMLLTFIGILVLLVSSGQVGAAFLQTEPAAGTEADIVAGLVDIGGRSLYLECRGHGSPTVILEAGAGNAADIWDSVALGDSSTGDAVWPGVASFTRVCAYDRPGTLREHDLPARSDDLPMPRTLSEIVSDLHALLDAGDVPGPYVLVGHSFWGLIGRYFASTYPDEVVGLVLVDAAHEDYYAAVREVLTPEQWALYAEAPGSQDSTLERIDTDTSAIEMREKATSSPLRPMPLIVLSHGRPWDWPEGYPSEALEGVWSPLQQLLADLVPDSRFVIAEESGHFIQLDQPDLVIEAIREIVEAVRDPTTWTS